MERLFSSNTAWSTSNMPPHKESLFYIPLIRSCRCLTKSRFATPVNVPTPASNLNAADVRGRTSSEFNASPRALIGFWQRLTGPSKRQRAYFVCRKSPPELRRNAGRPISNASPLNRRLSVQIPYSTNLGRPRTQVAGRYLIVHSFPVG
jgi:hypothetical protein